MLRNFKFQRATSAIVLVAFTSLTLSPLARAQNAYTATKDAEALSVGKMSRASVSGPSTDERFAQLLDDIHEDLKAIAPRSALGGSSKTGIASTDLTSKLRSIRAKSKEAKTLYASIEQNLASTEQHLKDAKLPKEILNRHAAVVMQYQTRKAEFDRLTQMVEQADDGGTGHAAVLADLGAFMAKYRNARSHQYTNPNKLPFGISNSKVRAPNVTREQYQANMFPPKYDKVLLAGPIPDGLTFTQSALPVAPNAADLAETEDVQITQAIKEQAAILKKDPVRIYNWVRNNIQFIPSYGSIQGSELTLQNKRGNAFDTASLLVALYRASGIPARYVYGTIDVPIAKVMNWVGGVAKAEAAQSLLGQGGIPNTALTSGGRVEAIRMEHVWVEAYVDHAPSRGAVNMRAQTWIPLDASFKQYDFISGMDIKSNVSANGEDLFAQIQAGATIDAAQGYVRNLNQANLQAQIANYEAQVKAYVDAQKSNATIADVLGAQKIKPENYSMLMGTLPYATVVTGSTFQVLPDALRWQFRTSVYAADGIADRDNPAMEINQSTAKLAGKKITLSFVPATKADQDLLSSYLPKPHLDGTPIQPNELPNSLPGYLLNLKAEFRVEGRVVARTIASFSMGSAMKQSTAYFNPGIGAWEGSDDNDIIVGEYDAIGMDLQGVGASQLIALQARMEATTERLNLFRQNPSDPTPINGLTREEVGGDLVYTGILAYFAQVDTRDNLIASTSGNLTTYRAPSYGRFFIAAQSHYFFGIVKSVSFAGAAMDIDYLRYEVASNDGSDIERAQFMRRAGATASASEHTVPEAMFRNLALAQNDPSQPQGVSAVKALAIAASLGQKIYMLNRNNVALHGSILQSLEISQDVKSEISDALAAGMDVSVHEAKINVNGWTGSGYVILDPLSGAGAYKIEGGTNGAYIQGALFGALAAAALFDIIIAVGVGGLAGPAMMIAAAGAALSALPGLTKLVASMDADERACFFSGFSTGFAVASFTLGLVVGGPVGAVTFGALGLIIGVAVGETINTTPGVVCRRGI